MNVRIRKWLLTSLLAIGSVAAVSYGIYYVWLTTPPAMPETLTDAVEVANSPRYRQLSPQRKEAYQSRIMELFREADDTEREALREKMRDQPELRRGTREVMREQMMDRVRQFAAAERADRKKILDEDIDRMQAMFRNRPDRGDRDGGGPPRGERNADDGERRQRPDRSNWRDRIQNRIEQGDPQRQALMMEYWQALRDRMEERGIDHPRRGGRR